MESEVRTGIPVGNGLNTKTYVMESGWRVD